MSLEELLSMEQLSAWSGYSMQTLYALRARGEGPASFKIGSGRTGRIRYRRSAVEAWLRELEQAEQESARGTHLALGAPPPTMGTGVLPCPWPTNLRRATTAARRTWRSGLRQ